MRGHREPHNILDVVMEHAGWDDDMRTGVVDSPNAGIITVEPSYLFVFCVIDRSPLLTSPGAAISLVRA